MPGYHDLYITTPSIRRTSIFNLPYSIQLHCTRTAGWQVWEVWNGQEKLLAGEYEGPDKGLLLDVNGVIIVDSLTQGHPLKEEENDE